MATTKQTLDITLQYIELNDANDNPTRKISVPCNSSTTASTITNNVKTLNQYLTNQQTSAGAIKDYSDGIKATFQYQEKDGADTYTYLPQTIIKAEIVTVTEDIIYGN